MVKYKRGGPVQRGLLNLWKLDDLRVSTTRFIDYKGFNDGDLRNTPTATTNHTQKNGNICMAFDGVNPSGSDAIADTLVTQTSKNLPFSVSLWFQTADANQSTELFHSSQGSADRFGLWIGSGELRSGVWNGSGYIDATSGTLPTNTWMHVVVTFDGSSNITLYCNGAVQTGTNNPALNAATDTQICNAAGSGSNNHTQADVSNVRIYDKELSYSEVTSLYRRKI